MLRPWVLALLAAACAVVAGAIPRGPWVDDIHIARDLQRPDAIVVEIDGQRVVVHAPEGYTIQSWGESSEPSVNMTMLGPGGAVSVVIAPGRIVDERRGAVAHEIIDGTTMTVFSRLPPDVVQRMFDDVEIS